MLVLAGAEKSCLVWSESWCVPKGWRRKIDGGHGWQNPQCTRKRPGSNVQACHMMVQTLFSETSRGRMDFALKHKPKSPTILLAMQVVTKGTDATKSDQIPQSPTES